MTHRTERDELRLILGLARQLGMTCCSTQQFRGSRQFEGLPDYLIFDPNMSAAFWWEAKAANGIWSLKQIAFRDLCCQCFVKYGIGTFADFCVFLQQWRGKAPTIPQDCEKWRGAIQGQPKAKQGATGRLEALAPVLP